MVSQRFSIIAKSLEDFLSFDSVDLTKFFILPDLDIDNKLPPRDGRD